MYAEQRGAQHAFDLVHSVRTEFAIDAVHRFLELCYSDYLHQCATRVPQPGVSPNGG